MDTQLRLAWLTENHPPASGGMARSGDRIVSGLRGLGVEVDVFHFSPRLRNWEERQQRRGRYFACPVREGPAHTLNRVWAGMETAGRDYSHVLAFGGSLPMQAGPVFGAWLDRPLLTLIRGNDFDAAVFNPRRAQVLGEALRRSARVCCVSRDKLKKIRALYPEAVACWVPNGIESTGWEAQPFDRERAWEWRERFVPPGRLVLGLFGHLKPKKGLLFFLESLLCSGLRERFHLLLVGDITPDAAEWLEQREAELSFTLLPFLDRYDLIPYFTACDYAVLPSFYDGMPNTMLEAMAMGLPLIAADTGAWRMPWRTGCTVSYSIPVTPTAAVVPSCGPAVSMRPNASPWVPPVRCVAERTSARGERARPISRRYARPYRWWSGRRGW